MRSFYEKREVVVLVRVDVGNSGSGVLRRVDFIFNSVPGKVVALASSFNDWDPAVAPMPDEKGDGCYRCSVNLPPGSYEYKFVVDGLWILDDENPEFVSNDFGTLNSVAVIA